MKRVLALCMACMVLVSAVASAEVKKGKDSFTGGIDIGSYVTAKPLLDFVSFSKNLSDNKSTYKLTVSVTQMKKYLLADSPIEVKIDQYPVYTLNSHKYRVSGPDSYGVEYNSSIIAEFQMDLVEKIKDSKRVALKCEDNNMLEIVYVLPSEVLAEWKEVINTEA